MHSSYTRTAGGSIVAWNFKYIRSQKSFLDLQTFKEEYELWSSKCSIFLWACVVGEAASSSLGHRHLPICEALGKDGHRSVALQMLLSLKGSCLSGSYIPFLEQVHTQNPINAPEQSLGPLASLGWILVSHLSSTAPLTITEASVASSFQVSFPLCPVLLPSPPTGDVTPQ